MIIVISAKKFIEHKKKLVKPKDYIIIDGTGSEDKDIKKFAGVVTVDGFAPPSKLMSKKIKDQEIELDIKKLEKYEKEYFKGKDFKTSSMCAVVALKDAGRPFNVFIVVSNKTYKYYGERIVKRIQKIFDVDFDFVFTYDQIKEDDKPLNKALKDSKLEKLIKRLKNLQDELNEKDK